MATYKVPGFKASNGVQSFKPLVDGEYTLECQGVEIKDPKNPAPLDVWAFTFKVLSGPPQEDGKPAKGKSYKEWVSIMREEHPQFEEFGHIGVDQLKSMAVAMGVQSKGDSLNPEAFSGCKMTCHIGIEKGKDGKDRNRIIEFPDVE